jgi:hypothetical protein
MSNTPALTPPHLSRLWVLRQCPLGFPSPGADVTAGWPGSAGSGPSDGTGTRQISTWPPQRRHVACIRAGCGGDLIVPAKSARRGGATAGREGVIVSGRIMFLAYRGYMDRDGAVRCGLAAEVRFRYVMNSSDGPPESVTIRCSSGIVSKGQSNSSPLRCLHAPQGSAKSSCRRPAWNAAATGTSGPRLRGHAGVRRPRQVRRPSLRGRPGSGLRIAGQREELGT